MNREVNLTKRVQTPNGLRYCPVVLSGNGRVNRIGSSSTANKTGIQKALITSNGAKVESENGNPSAVTRAKRPLHVKEKLLN